LESIPEEPGEYNSILGWPMIEYVQFRRGIDIDKPPSSLSYAAGGKHTCRKAFKLEADPAAGKEKVARAAAPVDAPTQEALVDGKSVFSPEKSNDGSLANSLSPPLRAAD
jgi:hypothetical protein